MRFVGSYNWCLDNELEEIETIFKSLYQKNHSLLPDQPHNFKDYVPMLQQVSARTSNPALQLIAQEHLKEKSFFTADNDIALYHHLRYLPCIWHSHDFLEIICVIQGACTHYIAQQTLEMKEGDICIVAPNTKHALSAFSDDGIVLNILIRISTFETAFFGTLSDNNVLSQFFNRALYHSTTYPYLYFRTGHDQDLFNFIGYVYEESCGKHQYKKQMMNSIITGFFVMLLRNHGTNVVVPDLEPLDKDKNLFYILKYMQEHYDTTTLQDMAAFFNYSERQIQRLIINATGISFSANILKLKMDQASRLLSKTDLSIADIAENVGYTDPRNFRRIFKKYYGMTPVEYRNQH